MKRVSWKYLAGLIDGEGCLDVQVTNQVYIRPRLRICLVESSRFLLDILQANHGGSICERKKSENPNWQNAVSWEIAGYAQACALLRNIVNHLFLKKEQARLLLWMETNLKGLHVSTEVRDVVREELGLMKRDPHRLSEVAQGRILGCDSRKA